SRFSSFFLHLSRHSHALSAPLTSSKMSLSSQIDKFSSFCRFRSTIAPSSHLVQSALVEPNRQIQLFLSIPINNRLSRAKSIGLRQFYKELRKGHRTNWK